MIGGGHNAFSRYERGEAAPLPAVVNLFRLPGQASAVAEGLGLSVWRLKKSHGRRTLDRRLAQPRVDALERRRAGAEVGRVERVERRLDGVEIVMQVLVPGIYIQKPGHDLACRQALLHPPHRRDLVGRTALLTELPCPLIRA